MLGARDLPAVGPGAGQEWTWVGTILVSILFWTVNDGPKCPSAVTQWWHLQGAAPSEGVLSGGQGAPGPQLFFSCSPAPGDPWFSQKLTLKDLVVLGAAQKTALVVLEASSSRSKEPLELRQRLWNKPW